MFTGVTGLSRDTALIMIYTIWQELFKHEHFDLSKQFKTYKPVFPLHLYTCSLLKNTVSIAIKHLFIAYNQS